MAFINAYNFENIDGKQICNDVFSHNNQLKFVEKALSRATYGKFNYYKEICEGKSDYVEICENGFYLVKNLSDVTKNLFNDNEYQEYIKNNIGEFDFIHLKNEKLQGFKSNRAWLECLVYDIHTIDVLLSTVNEEFPIYYEKLSLYLESIECMNLSVYIIKTTILRDALEFAFKVLEKFEPKITITDTYPQKKLNLLETYCDLLIKVFLFSQVDSNTTKNDVWMLTGRPYVKKEVLIPAFPDEDSVNVVFSSSDYFSAYLGVCLKSLIDNASSNRKYDIIIMERGISAPNKKRIIGLVEGLDNISVRFYNIGEMFRSFNFFINSERISEETYYGLLVPHILEEYRKAIIMDCDMIVKQDVAELYDTSLEGYVAGGVRDAILCGWLNNRYNDTTDYYKEIGAKNPSTFVNGGLLLIDFEKYRKNVCIDTITEYINKYQFRVVDQDVFNLILEGKVKALDVKWNHMVYVEGAISQAIMDTPANVGFEYFKAKENPGIIHYASENKPWSNVDLEFAEDFWEVARQTNFYEILMQRLIGVTAIGCVKTIPQVDNRSFVRKVADFFFPINTKRREVLRRIIPRDSRQWKVLKKIQCWLSFGRIK